MIQIEEEKTIFISLFLTRELITSRLIYDGTSDEIRNIEIYIKNHKEFVFHIRRDQPAFSISFTMKTIIVRLRTFFANGFFRGYLIVWQTSRNCSKT